MNLSVKVNVKNGQRVAKRLPNAVYVSKTCRLRHRIGRIVRGHGMGSVASTTPRPEVRHISHVRRTSSMQAIKVIIFVSFLQEVNLILIHLLFSVFIYFFFGMKRSWLKILYIIKKKLK